MPIISEKPSCVIIATSYVGWGRGPSCWVMSRIVACQPHGSLVRRRGWTIVCFIMNLGAKHALK